MLKVVRFGWSGAGCSEINIHAGGNTLVDYCNIQKGEVDISGPVISVRAGISSAFVGSVEYKWLDSSGT